MQTIMSTGLEIDTQLTIELFTGLTNFHLRSWLIASDLHNIKWVNPIITG